MDSFKSTVPSSNTDKTEYFPSKHLNGLLFGENCIQGFRPIKNNKRNCINSIPSSRQSDKNNFSSDIITSESTNKCLREKRESQSMNSVNKIQLDNIAHANISEETLVDSKFIKTNKDYKTDITNLKFDIERNMLVPRDNAVKIVPIGELSLDDNSVMPVLVKASEVNHMFVGHDSPPILSPVIETFPAPEVVFGIVYPFNRKKSTEIFKTPVEPRDLCSNKYSFIKVDVDDNFEQNPSKSRLPIKSAKINTFNKENPDESNEKYIFSNIPETLADIVDTQRVNCIKPKTTNSSSSLELSISGGVSFGKSLIPKSDNKGSLKGNLGVNQCCSRTSSCKSLNSGNYIMNNTHTEIIRRNLTGSTFKITFTENNQLGVSERDGSCRINKAVHDINLETHLHRNRLTFNSLEDIKRHQICRSKNHENTLKSSLPSVSTGRGPSSSNNKLVIRDNDKAAALDDKPSVSKIDCITSGCQSYVSDADEYFSFETDKSSANVLSMPEMEGITCGNDVLEIIINSLENDNIGLGNLHENNVTSVNTKSGPYEINLLTSDLPENGNELERIDYFFDKDFDLDNATHLRYMSAELRNLKIDELYSNSHGVVSDVSEESLVRVTESLSDNYTNVSFNCNKESIAEETVILSDYCSEVFISNSEEPAEALKDNCTDSSFNGSNNQSLCVENTGKSEHLFSDLSYCCSGKPLSPVISEDDFPLTSFKAYSPNFDDFNLYSQIENIDNNLEKDLIDWGYFDCIINEYPSSSNSSIKDEKINKQAIQFPAVPLEFSEHNYAVVRVQPSCRNSTIIGQGINDKSRGSTVTDFTDSLSPPSARHSLVHEGLTTSHCPDSGASGPRVPLPSHVLGSVKSSDTDHLEPSTCWPHSNPSQYSLSPSSVDRPELPVDLQGDLASESLNLSLRSNPNTNKQIDPGIIDLSTAPPSNTTTIRKVNLNTQLCPKRKRDFASKCARESTHKNDQHNMKLFLERGSYSSQPADDVWECPTQHNVQSSKEESKESSSIFNVNDHNKEITEDIDVLSSEITPGEDTSLNINIANLGRIEKSQHGDTNGIKSSHKETESSEKEISSDLNVLSSAISEDASHGKEVTEEDISCPCPPRCFQNLNPTTTPNLSVEKSSSEVIYVPSSSAMSDDQTLHLPRDSEVSSVDFTVLNTTSANLSPKETNLPQNVDDQGGELCGLKLCKETESSEKAISSDLNVLSSAISEDASHGKEVTEEDISCPCPPRCFQNLNPTTTPNLSVEKSSSEVIYVPSSSAMSDDQTLHLPRDSEVSSVDFTVLNTTSANLSPKETNLPQNVEDQGGELCGLKLRKETESSEKAISSDLNVLSSAISEDASHGKEVTEEDISCPCPPRCFQNLNPTTTPNLSVEKISSEVIYVPSSSAMSDDQTLHLPRDSEVSSGDPTVLNPTSANLSPKETNLPQNVEDQGGELCGLKLPKQTESSEKAISSDLNVLSSAISEDASHGKEVTEEDISCPCPPRCFQDLNSNTKDNLSVENISAEMVSAALTLHLTECSEINSGNKSSLNTSIANLEQLKRGRPKKKQSLCGYLSNLKLSKNTETSEDKNSTRNLRSASTKNASQKMTYNLPKCEVRLPAIRTLSHLKKIMNENGVTIVPAEFYNKLAHKEVGSSVDNGRFKKDNILGRTKDDTSLHVRSSLKRKIIEPIENPNKRQQLDLAETSSSHGTKHVQFSEGTAMGQDNNPVQPKCKRIRKRSSIQKLTTTQRFTIDRMRNDRIATWYSEAVKPTLVHQNVELNPDPFEAEKSPDLNQALAILKNLTQVTKTMTPTAPPVSEIPRAGIDPRTGKPCSCTFNDYSTECTGCKQYYDGILKAYRFQSLISHTSDGLAFALAPTDLKYNHNNLYIPTTSKVKRKKRRALIGRRKAGDKSAEQLESMPSTSNQKDPSERMPVRCLRRRKCKTRSLGFYNIRRMLDESTCPESGSSSDDDDHNRNSSGRGT